MSDEGILTPEMIEEAALKALENFGQPTQWMVPTDVYNAIVKLQKEHPELKLTDLPTAIHYCQKFGYL